MVAVTLAVVEVTQGAAVTLAVVEVIQAAAVGKLAAAVTPVVVKMVTVRAKVKKVWVS